MENKTERIMTRLTATDLSELKKIAKKENKRVSDIVRQAITEKCACGEDGYTGLFFDLTWKCPKCGKKNHWSQK